MSRVPYFPHGISSRFRPEASIADTSAIGKPVALLASAEEREVLVDLDNDDSSADRIVRKLYVCSTDDFYFFYNLIALSLQFLLYPLQMVSIGAETERITSMYADRIDIFDKA